MSNAEGFDYRESAQDLGSELGKTLRIHDDGSEPKYNPRNSSQSPRGWILKSAVVGEDSLFRELDARFHCVRLDGDLYLLPDGKDGK